MGRAAMALVGGDDAVLYVHLVLEADLVLNLLDGLLHSRLLPG